MQTIIPKNYLPHPTHTLGVIHLQHTYNIYPYTHTAHTHILSHTPTHRIHTNIDKHTPHEPYPYPHTHTHTHTHVNPYTLPVLRGSVQQSDGINGREIVLIELGGECGVDALSRRPLAHARAVGVPASDVVPHRDPHAVVTQEVPIHLVGHWFLDHIHFAAVAEGVAEPELGLAIEAVAVGAIAAALVWRVEFRAQLRPLGKVVFPRGHHVVTCITQHHIKCCLRHGVVETVRGHSCFVVLATSSQTGARGSAHGCGDVGGSKTRAEGSNLTCSGHIKHRARHANLYVSGLLRSSCGVHIFWHSMCAPFGSPEESHPSRSAIDQGTRAEYWVHSVTAETALELAEAAEVVVYS